MGRMTNTFSYMLNNATYFSTVYYRQTPQEIVVYTLCSDYEIVSRQFQSLFKGVLVVEIKCFVIEAV